MSRHSWLKTIFCIATVPAFAVLVGCAPCTNQNLPDVYIGLQANTKEDIDLAKDFLYQAYKESKSGNTFHIDLLKEDKTIRLLSKPAIEKDAMLDVINQIEETPSTNLATTSFFQHVKDLVEYKAEDEELHAYFIGSGTSEEMTLTDIEEILAEVDELNSQKNVYVYLVGISNDNRLPMSSALNPLGTNADIDGRNYSEWKDIVTRYNAAYCSL